MHDYAYSAGSGGANPPAVAAGLTAVATDPDDRDVRHIVLHLQE